MTTPITDDQIDELYHDMESALIGFISGGEWLGKLPVAVPRLLERIRVDATAIADLRGMLAERDATIGKMRAALDRINEIRNDIVGRQSINWSLHIYPLVAALNDAGYVSADYKMARANIVSANATIARLRAVARELLERIGDGEHEYAYDDVRAWLAANPGTEAKR